MDSWLSWRGGGFFPELKGTKSKCTEGKQWVVGVLEGGWLTILHGMEQEHAVRAGKHKPSRQRDLHASVARMCS